MARSMRVFSLLPATAALLLWTGAALALEPPTREQIERYKKDGTLKVRIADARRIGNDQISPRLVRRGKANLERARLQAQGSTAEEAEALVPMPAESGTPTTGTLKVFALLIAFPDYPPANSSAAISAGLSGAGIPGEYPYESLRNYYLRSSYNQLDIQCDVLGWYTTAYPRSAVAETYEGRDALILEALNYYDSLGHDFSQYDNDGDGRIDYFAVYWTGPAGAWSSFWWGYYTGLSGPWRTIDGKRIEMYSWQWESYSGRPFDASTVIHETGHALGLPDYYDYYPSVGPARRAGRRGHDGLGQIRPQRLQQVAPRLDNPCGGCLQHNHHHDAPVGILRRCRSGYAEHPQR